MDANRTTAPAFKRQEARLGDPPRGESRREARTQEGGGQHRHRHRHEPFAGLECVEAEHGLEVDRQDEERAEQDELLHDQRGEAGPQGFDLEQGEIQEGVASLALPSLLPAREQREQAEAAQDQEGDHARSRAG